MSPSVPAPLRRVLTAFANRPRRRRAVGGVLLVAGLVVVLASWCGLRLLQVHDDLYTAKAQIAQAKALANEGRLDDATKVLRSLRHKTRTARSAARDPLLGALGHLTGQSSSLAEVRTITATIDDLAANALPDVLAATDDLHGDALRLPNGESGVDIARVTDATTRLDRVVKVVATGNAQLAATADHPSLPGLASARASALREISSLSDELQHLASVSRLAPQLLGSNGPRTYFVALENSAEARGGGGIVGAYGVLVVEHGRMHIIDQGGDAELVDPTDYYPKLDAAYEASWGADGLNNVWRNATESPHFPDTVQLIQKLYENAAKAKPSWPKHLDGVLALDPAAAGAIVGASKPLTLADGTVLQGKDVAPFMESGIYEKYPADDDRTKRQDLVAGVESGVIDAALSGAPPAKLLSVLGAAAGAGDLRFGSTHPDEEKSLADLAIGGAIKNTRGPYLAVAVNNRGGDKLDAYLKMTVDWTAERCKPGTRTSTVAVTVTNTAPSSGLTSYVNGAATLYTNDQGHDVPRIDPPPYTNKTQLTIYGSVGATLPELPKDAIRDDDVDGDHVAVFSTLYLKPGETKTLTVHWDDPSNGPLHAPFVTPLPITPVVHVDVPPCGD